MPLQTLTTCFPVQERGQRGLNSRSRRPVSSQPTARPEMVVTPRPAVWREDNSLDDAERLRGGALGCACCGDKPNVQRNSPLEPPPESSQEVKTTKKEQSAQKAPAGKVPRISEPTPPGPSSPTAQPGGSKSKGASQLGPSSSTDAGRTLSSPAPQQASRASSAAATRTRHQTLPALPTARHASSAAPGGATGNPAFPPSLRRTGVGAPPVVEVKTMKP